MKKILLLVCLILFVKSFGQEIKIKSDKILFNGTPVGILNKNKRIYTILTLDKIPKFSVEMKLLQLKDASTAYWYTITDLTTNKTNEIPEVPFEGLSFERTIVASVSKGDYKFVTSSGIDEKAVSEFVNGTQTDISKGFESKNLKIIEDLKTEEALLVSSKVTISKDGIIRQPKRIKNTETGVEETKDITIGYITNQNVPDLVGRQNINFTVFNSKHQQIAKWEQNGEINSISGKFTKKQFTTINYKLVNLDLETFLILDVVDRNNRKFVGKLFSMGYFKD